MHLNGTLINVQGPTSATAFIFKVLFVWSSWMPSSADPQSSCLISICHLSAGIYYLLQERSEKLNWKETWFSKSEIIWRNSKDVISTLQAWVKRIQIYPWRLRYNWNLAKFRLKLLLSTSCNHFIKDESWGLHKNIKGKPLNATLYWFWLWNKESTQTSGLLEQQFHM